MDDALEARIALGKTLVREQVEYFSAQFGNVASEWKHDGSRVTEADIHLSLVFADAIGEAFQKDQFFSEELDHGQKSIPATSTYAWLLDPIDGTNNFARRIPTCSISLALLKDGNPVYGFIWDHASRKLIHGGSGAGLWLDDKKVERTDAPLNGQSLICVQGQGHEEAIADENALQRTFKLRGFGSSALHMAYAALGWTDGVIAHRVKSWDIAAGMALLSAVGGCTRFFDTEVFPIRSFNSKAEGFGHIAGTVEMCDRIEKATGRTCRYTF
ncbi:inositol monophosphatase [Pelagicoccus sp. SDUM812003]|uniref:inositol monophosphatase family protein n=1 Tax=Pelagicoccus sp. SDUM812003 TaxID=3041267 RepID=UPI00280F4042|nr:inositol monophosphatase [Pelagicoccus sp. SDUM812003]MDQ8204545.1 inositol monophosphatase [Pelagicoccus sp. SDUM812003]